MPCFISGIENQASFLFFLHSECIKENILELIFHKSDFVKKELHYGRFHVIPVISEMNLQEIALLVSGTA